MTQLELDPDRLLPADPSTRTLARGLYRAVESAPIFSPHGHVPAAVIADDVAFGSPAELLITPDHYVTRLLHANGVDLARLGLRRRHEAGAADAADAAAAVPEVDSRAIWRELCRHWGIFAGTPVRFWLQHQLVTLFGIDQVPSAENADQLHDQIAAVLVTDEFRPRALFERFRIATLATTDAPEADLSAHQALRDDPGFTARVLPTLRADACLDPSAAGWPAALDRLGEAAGIDCSTYGGVLDALRARRRVFAELGATATDTGVLDCGSEPLAEPEAERLHQAARAGSITPAEAVAYRHNMLYRFAEMAAEDGLVMQLHAGVIRGHHQPTTEAYGPDTGNDLPAVAAFTEPLTPILRDFGTAPDFRLVLFTVDETSFGREIGPLAGFYPSVYAGAPWWFLDTPAAISRYRQAVTDSAGFAKTSGFIDDTRAFCSIPARHDMSRRCDAAFLAELVVSGQLSESEAHTIAVDLVDTIPRTTFRLG